ncbi:ferredoxin reductase [Cupriavidus sp. SK-3]|uniref:NAD(P)/FAD-dependent oxidoreductase n=1 Tax=Cupriavidus sp. SK-3 TaxID=1470558 RepID=UPI00044F524F|nr:FAD-dependent oxidoreductase [Cupriavidus sp. SK-3]KDP88395.1 ferredoxin reductase [Cupriavidus sp. SK-3]
MPQDAPILIIGAGQAGATAAAALRSLGHDGGIVMVGGEVHAPYERPPLSKAVLADEQQDERIGVHAAGFYAEQGIDLRLGTTVTSLDPGRGTARCADGQAIAFSRCLLATGGRARTLPALPEGMAGVHYLRSLADARGLRAALRRERSVLVIGGGFLGLETASTARAAGLAVTVIEAAPRLLQRAVPAVFSDWLAQRVRSLGIDLRLGCGIASIPPATNGVAVTLTDGSALHAPLAVVAIGLHPDAGLARAAGLALHPGNGGIQVDAHCRTSAPGVFAAGDCTSQYQPLFGQEVRLESWQNANEQARIAAAAMLGVETAPAAVPWFWTDQLGCNIQMLGAVDPTLCYTLRGNGAADGDAPRFLLLGMAGAQLRHAIAVNAGGDLRQLRNLIEQRTACDIGLLRNTAMPLKQAVREAAAALAGQTQS